MYMYTCARYSESIRARRFRDPEAAHDYDDEELS